jgi:hypothetical protein
MKKLILLMLVSLVIFDATFAVADQKMYYSSLEISGVVKSVTPVELRVSSQYGPGRYHLYIFKITDNTRITGSLQKGAFVHVKYSQRKVIKAIVVTALEIEVLNPPNAGY